MAEEGVPDRPRWILSLRVRHPTEDREVEIRLESDRVRTIDAIFITTDSAKILSGFYEKVEKDKDKVASLREQIEAQRLGDICLVMHRRMTSFIVPEIDWSVRGPIRV